MKGNQGSALNFLHLEVGHYSGKPWAHGPALPLSVETVRLVEFAQHIYRFLSGNAWKVLWHEKKSLFWLSALFFSLNLLTKSCIVWNYKYQGGMSGEPQHYSWNVNVGINLGINFSSFIASIYLKFIFQWQTQLMQMQRLVAPPNEANFFITDIISTYCWDGYCRNTVFIIREESRCFGWRDERRDKSNANVWSEKEMDRWGRGWPSKGKSMGTCVHNSIWSQAVPSSERQTTAGQGVLDSVFTALMLGAHTQSFSDVEFVIRRCQQYHLHHTASVYMNSEANSNDALYVYVFVYK